MVNYALVFSMVDPVSRGVWQLFLNNHRPGLTRTIGDYEVYRAGDNVAIRALGKDIVYLDEVEDIINEVGGIDELVFISRHAMQNPRPMFTTHVTGNWGAAELGGRPGVVSLANPHTITAIFRELCRLRGEFGLESFECHVEATHHGPTITLKPVTFIEQGSTERDWGVERGWELLFTVVEELLEGKITSNAEPAISIGDLHYITFSERLLRGEADLGHSIPKYIRPVTEDMIVKAVTMMTHRPVKAYVNWKSFKGDERRVIVDVLNKLNVKLIKRE
ncbi:D-aminoacyl-tRNA deacylase [Vulcanisaeta thermophila]|uniref:D-aminoacyl-tRNA deacylase n=1 Tax=Vulcanisaeta thermophila TaxID=867917 RepID=UPI0008535CF0|nr:D-aminoacyl-tRNA deacylase [Vulcanisaeta thermophila]